MKLKCTALGSYVMTAKPLQRCNNSEVLKFKDFQGPLTSNSKTFKALFHFPGLSRSCKNGKKFKDFQELSRPCGHPESTPSARAFCSQSSSNTTQHWNEISSERPSHWATQGRSLISSVSCSKCHVTDHVTKTAREYACSKTRSF